MGAELLDLILDPSVEVAMVRYLLECEIAKTQQVLGNFERLEISTSEHWEDSPWSFTSSFDLDTIH